MDDDNSFCILYKIFVQKETTVLLVKSELALPTNTSYSLKKLYSLSDLRVAGGLKKQIRKNIKNKKYMALSLPLHTNIKSVRQTCTASIYTV